LAKTVPGMADSSHTITESGQTLRGRETLVLVDGIPLNTNRGSSRNLANINLANVEQVEVLRGSSAIYGSGATGGIISIRTRRPEGKTLAETTITGITPLSELNVSGLGGELQHYMSGAAETIDYTLSLGARNIGGSFDAKGNRIAPEPSQGDIFDSNTYNIATKLGFKLDANQRIQLSGSYYDIKQNTDYASDTSVARLPPGTVPAAALKGLELEQQNRVQNTLLGLDYEHRNLSGNTLAAQIYYRDFFTRFSPFDARRVPVRGANVDQSMQNSEVYGGRLTIKSPLGDNKTTQLVWGGDFHNELTDMPLDVFNPALYDSTGGLVFQKIGKVIYMPEVTTKTSGVFAQLQHRFNEQWSVEAGARYDRATASFDNFIPLSQSRVASPRSVAGGTVEYDSPTYNAGAVYSVTKEHEFYTSYSEGFQLPDIGLQVRNATPAFNINSSNLEAVLTDSLEFGWRGRWENTLANLSVFESRSDLGAVQSFNNGLRLTRTKERIQGAEAGIDYFTDDERWSFGSTLTWMQGEELTQNASHYQDMPGNRIPPLKFTAYLEYRPTTSWSHRLQSTSYEGRDYRLNGVASFGRRDTTGYTNVDLISQWKVDEKSSVVIGLENLLNHYYYPLYSQLMRNDNNTSHLPASGTVLKLSFTHKW
ncbi:MAG TPA: TonB-dependent siderophore receptor, partial [Cellvibrio sp.]|nr:TonB-dependent siderophore receptor [Cellvibrio sp.]